MKRDAYSSAEETRTADGGSHIHFPAFDLSYSLDDHTRPSEVTIFEHGPDIDVRWLTVDKRAAIPLEDCR